jgi:hypothetical protein
MSVRYREYNHHSSETPYYTPSRNTGLVMYEAITFAPLASQHTPESRSWLPTELVETFRKVSYSLMIPYNRNHSTTTYKWPYSIALRRMRYYLLLPNTNSITIYTRNQNYVHLSSYSVDICQITDTQIQKYLN